ncbi:MAG: prolyl oligopeptidase family serine peptidase [Candidatus Tyrphobacter sp.]
MHARPIDLAAFRTLATISSPRVSPHGRRIAFVSTIGDMRTNVRMSTLEIVAATGGSPRAVSAASSELSDPQWSPNGKAIAYIDRGDKGKSEIFVLSFSGGARREITHARNGVEQYAWSPDGTRFAYVTQDVPIDAAAARHGDNLFTIHDDGYRITGPPQPSHLYVISSGGGTARKLTRGSASVLEAAPPFVGATSDPSWSADGRYIAFTRQADADDSDSDRTRIALVDVGTGAARYLTGHPKYEYQPLFARGGDRVAFIYPHGPGPISVMNVETASASSAAVRDVSGSFDRDLSAFAWLPHGEGFIGMADDGIGVGLWRIPLSGVATRLHLGSLNVEDFDVGSDGTIALVLSNETRAPEVYVMRSWRGTAHRLTDVNAKFAAYRFGSSHELRWSAPDGTRSDGIVTYPVGYVAGRTYPLVVYLHGGPEAASSQTFDGGEIGRLRYGLSGRGFIVFEPNYRGSDSLGNTYEHAIYRDPGAGPASDVMAGIAALERSGAVDERRISVVGHSYGGYMTAWLIGHEHIWRCAVVADGMVDWREEYDLSAAGNLAWTRDSLGGTPMNPSAAPLYITGSPITYASQITTPTLILSGTSDETVPIPESFALYHALEDRGVPVRFVGLPGALHSPHKPVQVDRYYATILRWVVRHTR